MRELVFEPQAAGNAQQAAHQLHAPLLVHGPHVLRRRKQSLTLTVMSPSGTAVIAGDASPKRRKGFHRCTPWTAMTLVSDAKAFMHLSGLLASMPSARQCTWLPFSSKNGIRSA